MLPLEAAGDFPAADTEAAQDDESYNKLEEKQNEKVIKYGFMLMYAYCRF